MKVIRYRGPRATIQAPPGRYFIGFDADGLHLRIASTLSKDPFMLEALVKYDQTGDLLWKPHIQNCSALFQVKPEQAIEWMKHEDPKYTFAKNFIYLILNGGDVPALKNSAVSAGLSMDEDKVKKLLDSWLERAIMFKRWREGLVNQVKKTGILTLPSGRRRRFYGARYDKGEWKLSYEVIKEIYNLPLLGTEVDFMNPRFLSVWKLTQGTAWFLFYHGHDGGMVEGPWEERMGFGKRLLASLPEDEELAPGLVLHVPFSLKGGVNWASLGEVE
jgi:hypothetical protein